LRDIIGGDWLGKENDLKKGTKREGLAKVVILRGTK